MTRPSSGPSATLARSAIFARPATLARSAILAGPASLACFTALLLSATVAFFGSASFPAGLTAQEGGVASGPVGPSPYDVVTGWHQPFAEEGFAFGGNSGVIAESADRIIVAQRGETRLPDPVPDDYLGFAGSIGINVLSDTERRVWRNCLYVLNREGEVAELWDHWDYLCEGSDGPGPHRIRISPYDHLRRIWVVNETFHQIHVLSNDGRELVRTLGEKGVPGDDETHFGRPQDVAFLPDGRILVADGLDNHRVVILDEDGRYISEFGGRGEAPGEFDGIHALGIGPAIGDETGHRIYALDRSGGRVNIFLTTEDPGRVELVDTWDGFNLPLEVVVNEDAVWLTDLDPLRFIRMSPEGEHLYTWLVPDEMPDGFAEVHTLSVDDEGNLYAGDNLNGRTQKLVPKPGADPDLLIDRAWVDSSAVPFPDIDLSKVGPSPYRVIPFWHDPFGQRGFAFGGSSGVFAESPDRIFIAQRGVYRLPDPVPPQYAGFAGSIGVNVLTDTDPKVWRNCLYTLDSEGTVRELWRQWDHLCEGADGPGPHRLRISPYDPDGRVWVVNETYHQIYVLSNDGRELLATLGERGVPGDDETHFGQPQDVAFLPDGRVLVADGLANHRVVILNEGGGYLGEFGGYGEEPGQFQGIHAVAVGPPVDGEEGNRIYALDRSGGRINVFRTTGEPGRVEHVDTWDGLGLPLDIIVNDDDLWITDLRPLRFVNYDFEGNVRYTWLVPPDLPNGYLEVHTFSVDSEGNLYGGDNQYGRTQKFLPREQVGPELLIEPPWADPEEDVR